MAERSFRRQPEGPFDLRQSITFAAGFAPIASGGDEGSLTMAFADESAGAVGFRVRQPDGVDTEVVVEWTGEIEPDRARAQIERILSLDVHAAGFSEVGERDSVVGELQRRFPGRRPVCFGTPFEAGCWAVLSQRTPMARAASIRDRLADELGERLTIGGEKLVAPAAPAAIADLAELEGVWPVKVARLRGLAETALDGRLDAVALRGFDAPEALRRLQQLPGIGPFGAALILVRGAGHPDVLPLAERRLRSAVAAAYGLDPGAINDEHLTEIAEPWRPYRSWVAFLLRNAA